MVAAKEISFYRKITERHLWMNIGTTPQNKKEHKSKSTVHIEGILQNLQHFFGREPDDDDEDCHERNSSQNKHQGAVSRLTSMFSGIKPITELSNL